MKTRYGLSPWVDNVPRSERPDYPRLRGDLAADVVIVGGGLTGCATAYAAAAAGLQVVVVEAERIGQAGAGHGAGLLLADPGPSFRDVAATQGLRLARRIFESWRQASVDAAAQLTRLKIGCRLRRQPHLLVAAAADESALKKEQLTRQEAGFRDALVTAAQLRTATGLPAAAGIRVHDAFSVDPYAASIGLAAAAATRRARLFERTPMVNVKVGQKSLAIVCASGTIHAAHVVIATGGPTAEYKPLQRHFTLRDAYMVLTEPVPAAMQQEFGRRDSVVEDLGPPRHRLLWTPDDRLLIAGVDQPAAAPRLRDGVLVQRTGQSMYELLMKNPNIAGLRPDYGWSAPYAETADRLMFIGPHRNYPRHLFALGGSSDSVTGSFLAARILTRALQGAPGKGDDDLGWAARRLS